MTETTSELLSSSSPTAATPAKPSRADPRPPCRGKEPNSNRLRWMMLSLLILVAVGATVGIFALNRKIERIEMRVAVRNQSARLTFDQMQLQSQQAIETAHQAQAQIARLEGKLADIQALQQALQNQFTDLAHHRSDWTLSEVEQILSIASQQLQLTGNLALALFALQNADAQLASLQEPQFIAVRQAIAHDIERLKSTPTIDLTGLAIKLDDAAAQVDMLPLAGETLGMPAPVTPASYPKPTGLAPAPAPAATRWRRIIAWWDDFRTAIGEQIMRLMQVRRIDHPDALLVAPQQGYYVRQNLKLRLLSARLALLTRNQVSLKSDLLVADAALERYFEASSKRVQTVRALIQQVEHASPAVELPSLRVSLNAIHQHKR